MTDCIDTEYSCKPDGYAQRHHEGKKHYVHRVAYACKHNLKMADIADKVVLHTCDNPKCVNPKHLVLGTQLDNIADRQAKGRSGAAPRTANAETVLKIRATNGTNQEVAKLFGVSASTVSDIRLHCRAYKE